jgi:Cdc6-like AAA superfamily ATPase
LGGENLMDLKMYRDSLANHFTPTSPAVHNYVNREKEDEEFSSALTQPGLQIIVYGPTGVGKTSMVWSTLEKYGFNYLMFPFDTTITKENLCSKIMNKLGFEKRTQQTVSKEQGYNGEVAAGGTFWSLITFKGKIGANGKKIQTDINVPYYSDADVDAVVDALHSTGCVLYFDDLEKVKDDEIRLMIAHMGKKLSDKAAIDFSGAKIIYAGISQEVSKLIALDSSLRARLADQMMSPLQNEQIMEILTLGWEACGFDFSNINMNKIVETCCGYARYAHWIGQEAALSAVKNGRTKLTEDDVNVAYDIVIRKYQDDYQSRFDRATNHKSGLRIRERILFAMALSPDIEVHTDYIIKKVSELAGQTLNANQISGPLGELKKEQRGAILEQGRMTGYHRFTDLMIKPYIRILYDRNRAR